MSVVERARMTVGVLAMLGAGVGLAHGQGAYTAPASGATPPTFRAPGSYERLSSGNNPALNFFGGTKSLRHTPRTRRTSMPAPRPVQTAPIAKPFSQVQQASNISPYLALDALETQQTLPNYFLYVRPQLEQRQQFQVQQAQYWRLQQQMRASQAGGAATAGPSGGIPTTGHSAQFMNNGGYYPGLR